MSKITIDITDKSLKATWINGEQHLYRIADPYVDHIVHSVSDMLADKFNDWLRSGIIEHVATAKIDEPLDASFIERTRRPLPQWFMNAVSRAGVVPVEGAGELQLEGAGELQLEGAGELQLRTARRKPIGIEHISGEFDPRGHIWLVQFNDGTIEKVTEPCAARAYAEDIYRA